MLPYVLRELLAALVDLLQALRDIFHPRVVRLQGLLHVPHVQTHRGDLGRHGGFHALPRGDDGVGRVDTGPHLVQVNVHGIHGRGKVLHVPLASKYDALHLGSVRLRGVQHVLQLAHVVLQRVQVVGEAFHAGRTGGICPSCTGPL